MCRVTLTLSSQLHPVELTTEDLYQRYGRQIYNLVYYHLNHTEEAEEVTQDVFVAAHFQKDHFRNEAQWGTYLYRIAVNKCIDRLRTRQRRAKWLKWVPWSDIPMADSTITEPAPSSNEEVRLQWLMKALDELPPNQRTAFLLMKMEGKSQKEVGEIMRLTSKAVESLVQRAMTSLKKNRNGSKDFMNHND